MSSHRQSNRSELNGALYVDTLSNFYLVDCTSRSDVPLKPRPSQHKSSWTHGTHARMKRSNHLWSHVWPSTQTQIPTRTTLPSVCYPPRWTTSTMSDVRLRKIAGCWSRCTCGDALAQPVALGMQARTTGDIVYLYWRRARSWSRAYNTYLGSFTESTLLASSSSMKGWLRMVYVHWTNILHQTGLTLSTLSDWMLFTVSQMMSPTLVFAQPGTSGMFYR